MFMWGKIFFAMLMFLGMLISFSNKDYRMATFFALVVGVMIWIIRKRPRQELVK